MMQKQKRTLRQQGDVRTVTRADRLLESLASYSPTPSTMSLTLKIREDLRENWGFFSLTTVCIIETEGQN